jgi:hypothetical protein
LTRNHLLRETEHAFHEVIELMEGYDCFDFELLSVGHNKEAMKRRALRKKQSVS